MRDITFLELVPIVLALYLLKKKELSERRIRFQTDNKALVPFLYAALVFSEKDLFISMLASVLRSDS
jgi:hypothetical protein